MTLMRKISHYAHSTDLGATCYTKVHCIFSRMLAAIQRRITIVVNLVVSEHIYSPVFFRTLSAHFLAAICAVRSMCSVYSLGLTDCTILAFLLKFLHDFLHCILDLADSEVLSEATDTIDCQGYDFPTLGTFEVMLRPGTESARNAGCTVPAGCIITGGTGDMLA